MIFLFPVEHQKPKLYELDDFNECKGKFQDWKYCVANFHIRNKSHSKIYDFIMELSSESKRHLRHDRLMRGICMNDCTTIVNCGNISTDIITECLNERHSAAMSHKFDGFVLTNLSYYCIDSTTQAEHETDFMANFVVSLLIFILAIVILSSLYDILMKLVDLRPLKFLTLFSLIENYKKLIAPPKPSAVDLQFIELFRTVMIYGVIENHVAMHTIIFPSMNPSFIEETFSSWNIIGYMSGNPAVQTFFVIGAFLSTFSFMEKKLTRKDENLLRRILRSCAGRWLRIYPILILTMLVHSSIISRWCRGPLCDHVLADEKRYCRRNWWTNLLFINNYVKIEEKCVLHSWYLSADFWLRNLAIFCLEKTTKSRRLRIVIFLSILTASFASLSYTIYDNAIDPIALFTPE